jgi:hypothetical protein
MLNSRHVRWFVGAGPTGAVLVACALIVGLATGTARAQSGGPYTLDWSTVDGGGRVQVAGGSYDLAGTAGQPDAGLGVGSPYLLAGGFWPGAEADIYTAAPDETPVAGPSFALHPATPNPFNPRTAVAFDLPRGSHVELRVHDLRGRVVRVLESGVLERGRHVRHWNGRDDTGRMVASGVYIFTIDAGEHHAEHKGLLVK